MANLKLSLIGAGSGGFSVQLVKDLCKSRHLSGITVCLMDVDPQRLDAVYTVCTALNRQLAGGLRVEKTQNRTEALKGAHAVINTALTAGHDRLRAGWEVAKKWGFDFAGSLHVMFDEAFWVNHYQLRFFEELTRDILTWCPGAWHLMVANPVIAGTTLLQRKYPAAKHVGLCHGYYMIRQMAEEMGYGRHEVTYRIPGINHFVFLNRGHINGEDIFPLLDAWMADPAHAEDPRYLTRKRLDFYRRHGVLGIGDTLNWTGGSWPWWYHSDPETTAAYGEKPPAEGWDWYFDMVAGNAAAFIAMAQNVPDDILAALPFMESDELIIPLVESLLCDVEGVHIVNLLNRGGLVPGLPEDFAVEVPALCGAGGVDPIHTDPLPKPILAYALRDRVAPVEMELAAYQSGKRHLLEELVLMDKWATSLKQVRGFMDELLALPFNAELKAHYSQ